MHIVTIDGPVASGKTSVSRELAKKLSWSWVSTGVFYRGVAAIAYKNHLNVDSEEEVVDFMKKTRWRVKLSAEQTLFFYNDEDLSELLRESQIGALSSRLAAYRGVRQLLLEPQKKVVEQASGGLIAEGRDCGTVVFPSQALLKVYLTASSEHRVQRRSQEKGEDYQEVRRDQRTRDERERTRAEAPLKKASDSVILDSTFMGLEEVVSTIEGMILQKIKKS